MGETHRIIIQPNGPYFVRGTVPLTVLPAGGAPRGRRPAISEPGLVERVRPIYALCRCGVSEIMPFCDGLHLRLEWDWAETADRAPATSRARRFAGPDSHALLDDASLCTQARFCRAGGTDAWALIRKTQDLAARRRLFAMVESCPSGRLVYERSGADVLGEPERAPRIAVVPGGPFWVRGDIALVSWNGEAYAAQPRRALCRCGASQNKPFCDGRHLAIGFEAG